MTNPSDYKSQAMGDKRPQFTDGVDLGYAPGAGQATTTLDSISILYKHGTNYASAALYVSNAADVILKNVNISNIFDVSSLPSSVYYSAYGIYTNNSSITFAGGNSTVSGTATDDSATYIISGDSAGIAAHKSQIYFNDGTNNVYGSNISTGTNSSAAGIWGYASTITFSSGENTISGTNTNSKAYGIYLYCATIKFANPTAQKVTITANGTAGQYGIYATYGSASPNPSTLLDKDGNNMSSTNIGNYVTFKTSNTNIGSAVLWDGAPPDTGTWPLPW